MIKIAVSEEASWYYPNVMRSTCSYKTIEAACSTEDYLTIDSEGNPQEFIFSSENDYGDPHYFQCTECNMGAESLDDPDMQRHLAAPVEDGQDCDDFSCPNRMMEV